MKSYKAEKTCQLSDISEGNKDTRFSFFLRNTFLPRQELRKVDFMPICDKAISSIFHLSLVQCCQKNLCNNEKNYFSCLIKYQIAIWQL